MTAKEKAAPLATGTASNTAFTERNSTAPDPLQGWFNLAKPAQDRQPKRNWKHGKQRGRIDGFLLAHLATLAVIVVLLVGGLTHA